MEIEHKLDDEMSVESTPTLSSGSSTSESTPTQHSNHEIIPPQHALITNGNDNDIVIGNRSDTPVPKNKKFNYVSNSDVLHNDISEDQEQEFDPLD